MGSAFHHHVSVEPGNEGRAVLRVQLAGPLTSLHAGEVATVVTKRIEALKGQPFGLLFDLRAVTDCDAAGAKVMQHIEMAAAARGLWAVAHLVEQPTLAHQATKATKAEGGEHLIGTFADESAARDFASGKGIQQ